jgi:hypothetical protein
VLDRLVKPSRDVSLALCCCGDDDFVGTATVFWLGALDQAVHFKSVDRSVHKLPRQCPRTANFAAWG